MEAKFKHSLYDRVVTPKGDTGIITDLGVNNHSIPVYWVEFNDMNIPNTWYNADRCKSPEGLIGTEIDIDFYYDINDTVESPLSKGIITYMSYSTSEKVSCVVTNKEQGVSNDWWAASVLTKASKL